MVVRKAFKYKLRMNHAGNEVLLYQYAGCCRLVWNKALALQKERLDAGKHCLSYNEMAKILLQWKKQLPFLRAAPSQALQQRLMDLDRALREAFDKKNPKRFPKFKKKYRSSDSFRYPQGFKIAGNLIFLPKIGWMRFYKSRSIVGDPKNVTVSLRGGSWYLSVQTEQEIKQPVHSSKMAVGGDFGVKRLLTLSSGKHYDAIHAYRADGEKLAKEQRKLARMIKKSNNWKKQKRKIQDIHIRIADVRLDHLHTISHEVSKNHVLVVLEDLDIQHMSASAKGTVDNPGKNVKQKAGLNKAILDQGRGEFKRQIKYKQDWRGGMVIFVDPVYSSQECSVCGHISSQNRPSQEEFHCTRCGYSAHADENSAKVVLSRGGHPRVVCGSNGALMPSEAETDKAAA